MKKKKNKNKNKPLWKMGFVVFFVFAFVFVCVVNERWVVAYKAFIYGRLEGFRVMWGLDCE